MQSNWPTWILPFGMIGTWLVFGIIELIRTPTPTRAPQRDTQNQG